jgi:uncharacterized protein YebE (UPF0316 family)
MTSLLVLIFLFLVGALEDWLCALYLRKVGDDKVSAAVAISIIHTIVRCSVLATLTDELLSGGKIQLIAYALGGGLGTFCGLRKKSRLPTN